MRLPAVCEHGQFSSGWLRRKMCLLWSLLVALGALAPLHAAAASSGIHWSRQLWLKECQRGHASMRCGGEEEENPTHFELEEAARAKQAVDGGVYRTKSIKDRKN